MREGGCDPVCARTDPTAPKYVTGTWGGCSTRVSLHQALFQKLIACPDPLGGTSVAPGASPMSPPPGLSGTALWVSSSWVYSFIFFSWGFQGLQSRSVLSTQAESPLFGERGNNI